MNNGEDIILTETPIPNPTPTPQKETRLVDISISDENIALNVIVSFVTLAHKRGAFGIDESAKIWECIRMFQKPM
jgi:hypothetical protein